MEHISIISLITNTTGTVQAVIGILALFSVMSWGIIFAKWITLGRARRQTFSFIKQYNNSSSMINLYNAINTLDSRSTTCQMFYAGLNEYNRLNKSGVTDKSAITANIERALTATIDEEIDGFENNLSTLATFGSVSPYIGLFGTVWGIMHAFIGLGNSGQATIASVAPGISEALIATAIGLFVAIPAYIAYNKFSAEINSLDKTMHRFGDELLNLINRKLLATSATSSVQDM